MSWICVKSQCLPDGTPRQSVKVLAMSRDTAKTILLWELREIVDGVTTHEVVVVDEQYKVIGIISLSDLLVYLVLRPGDCEGASLRNDHGPIEERDETPSREDSEEIVPHAKLKSKDEIYVQ